MKLVPLDCYNKEDAAECWGVAGLDEDCDYIEHLGHRREMSDNAAEHWAWHIQLYSDGLWRLNAGSGATREYTTQTTFDTKEEAAQWCLMMQASGQVIEVDNLPAGVRPLPPTGE